MPGLKSNHRGSSLSDLPDSPLGGLGVGWIVGRCEGCVDHGLDLLSWKLGSKYWLMNILLPGDESGC